MKQNEDKLTKLLLKSEGGYVDHPNDPGGPTNYGITIRDARKYWKANATAADVRAMPLSVALDIYDKRYWDPLRCDDLPSGIDYVIYDYGVNSGIGRPPQVLRAIFGLPKGGSMDSLLVAKAKAANQHKLIDAICDERLAFMKRIRDGSAWESFGRGWSRRVANVRAVAHRMVDGEKLPTLEEPTTAASTKATTVDPGLTGKIAGAAAGTGGVSTAATALTGSVWLTVAVAVGLTLLVGAIGYLIYRRQHARQLEVILPPGTSLSENPT